MTSLRPAASVLEDVIPREFGFDENQFQRISRLAELETGIVLGKSKSALVYSRLVRRLRVLRLESFEQYCALVESGAGADEKKRMLDALTTNVTRFFREPHHFEHLKTRALPAVVQGLMKGGRIRIWSAGCSTGQEPYSIALTVLSTLSNVDSYDIKILATDISANVLEQAQEGVYSQEEAQSIPESMLRRFTERRGEGFSFHNSVRNLISFKQLNLFHDWPMTGEFDVVFCRNVMIYFSEDSRNEIWRKFTSIVKPDGVVYIGHSERISTSALEQFSDEGITTYRKNKVHRGA